MTEGTGSMEELVGSFVDLRTSFGKKALARAENLKGPRRTALVELISHLKEKGISRLSKPLRFLFRGCEKGEKFERIGKSIAGPELRYLYKYSIGYAQEKRAGYVEGAGFVGVLGEITVGRVLKEELPVLLPVFGDDRYKEFFSSRGKKKRGKELEEVVRKDIYDVIVKDLRRTGHDVSEFEKSLEEFLVSASLVNKGSDLYWLRRQLDEGKIINLELERALTGVLENPEYDKEDAILVGNSIMELRQKPTKGLIGSFIDDLVYLSEPNDYYSVNLGQKFTRRQFYPERKDISDGIVGLKLKQNLMSFAEALGIIRTFPGIMGVRKKINRENAEKYFGEKAVENLNAALEVMIPALESDKKEYHGAKKSGRKEDLFLKDNYFLAREIDEVRKLGDGGNWANLTTWIRMKDSESTFSGMYTLTQQIKLAQSSQDPTFAAGVMATGYENGVDFKIRTGIDLEDLIRRVKHISCERESKEDKNNARKVKTTLAAYRKFRKNLKNIEKESEFNLVKFKLADKLEKFYSIVKDYRENSGDLGEKTGFLVRLGSTLGLRTYSDLLSFAGEKYLNTSEIKDIERFYSKLDRRLRLKLEELGELEAKRKDVDNMGGKTIYRIYSGQLDPISTKADEFLSTFFGSYSCIEPRVIRERDYELKTYKTGKELGESFIAKLKAINNLTSARYNNLETDRKTWVRKLSLQKFISEIEKRPGDIFVEDSLVNCVDEIYGKVEKRR